MGSGQSSQSNTGSFSVDPSGNISYEQIKPEARANNRARDRQNSRTDIDPTKSHIVDQSAESENSLTNGQKKLATSGDMPSKEDTLSLKEADEIVSRMKLKYKTNSAEMAGKNKSTFEDIEQDLTQCYRVNKDQPIKCLELTKRYTKMVEEYRSRMLKNVDQKVISAK